MSVLTSKHNDPTLVLTTSHTNKYIRHMYSKEFDNIIQFRRSNRAFDASIEVPEEVMIKSLERTVLSPNRSNMQ